MNATNRLLNRGLLLVVGCVLGLSGTALILTAVRPSLLGGPVETAFQQFDETFHTLSRFRIRIVGVGEFSSVTLLALGIAVALLILLIVFVATRGGGKTKTVLSFDDHHGNTEVDHSVADAVIAAQLRNRPDVLSARTEAYRVRGIPAIKLTVTARRRAHLSYLFREIEKVIAEWDSLVGEEMPVVVHMAGRGWVDRWRSATVRAR